MVGIRGIPYDEVPETKQILAQGISSEKLFMESERAEDEGRVLVGYPNDALHIDVFSNAVLACA